MPLKKIKKVIKKLPEHKQYFEVVAAILTIPVLITVILLNVNSLSQSKIAKIVPTQTPAPTIIPRVIIRDRVGNQLAVTPTPNALTPTLTPTPTSSSCQQSIGPISISQPAENQTVTDNPLCFIIQHDNNYCSVVWSYRINNGPYSDYTSDAPCVYNMPNGATEFDLRVQSTVSSDQTTLQQNFMYEGNTNAQVTLTPTVGM